MKPVFFVFLVAAAAFGGSADSAGLQSAASIAKWREDIRVAETQFLPKDKSYSASARAAATQRLDSLSAGLPALSDQQIAAELARVAALAGNAHTRAYLLRNRGWWRRYPLRIWRFADGWYVVAAKPGYEQLLGGRIVRIAGRSIAEAQAAVAPLYAGPPTWGDYMASYSLTSPDALLGTGLLHGDGSARFDVIKDGRTLAATLQPVDEPRRTAPEESWWFLSPANAKAAGWSQMLAGRPLPEYLAQPNDWYDLRQCIGNLFYLPFSRSEDQPGRLPLEGFGREVMRQLAASPDARLIVDLRFNTGGNLQKTRSFFEELARSPTGQTRGRLFVILGPSTFSAGITPAAILKASSKATFVGSEPGDRLRFWAEGGNVVLPNSGITLHYADRAHLYVPDSSVPADLVYLRLDAGSLKPDLPAQLTFSDYVHGRDPAAERILPSGLRCSPSL